MKARHIKSFDNFPSYMACYVMYGDASGVTDEDIKNYEEFLEDENLKGHAVYFGDETGFYAYPCFGLGTDCIKATFMDF